MKKILVIEDEKDVRDSICDILSLHNYKVLEAADGKDGLIAAITQKPDLIISDVMMPEMDGFQLMNLLQKNNELFEVPVIFLTAKVGSEDFRTGLRMGAADYITKPFRMEELLNSVKMQIEKAQRHQKKEQMYFMLVFDNPFTGVFYYFDNKFCKINAQFSQLCGYTLSEINKMSISALFAGDSKQVTGHLNNCYKGIETEILIPALLLAKNRQVIEVDIYAKNMNSEQSNALLGSIARKGYSPTQQNQPAEFQSVINYLKANENNEAIREVLNAAKILKHTEQNQINEIIKKYKISSRELEVLNLICRGFTNQEIAEKLFISSRTVDNHRSSLLQKTETNNTASLVAFSIKNRLIEI